jgi:HNH endonuclease
VKHIFCCPQCGFTGEGELLRKTTAQCRRSRVGPIVRRPKSERFNDKFFEISAVVDLIRGGLTMAEVGSIAGYSRQRVEQHTRQHFFKPLRVNYYRGPVNTCRTCSCLIFGPSVFCSKHCLFSDKLLNLTERIGECLVWKGAIQPNGYGSSRYLGERYAHRCAWIYSHGPIPKGMQVLHTCDNPPCVNVDHLFLGTGRDNVADRDEKGRGVVAVMRPEDIAECITTSKLTNTQPTAPRGKA